jgi:sulfatase maturation enzyme AslB (radical SAM superfamily)
MSFETAMKALHRFKECFDGTEYPVISFYGGEPLLEFDLIKKNC